LSLAERKALKKAANEKHVQEMRMLENVTQLAPSHGKELDEYGNFRYDVKDVRKDLLSDGNIRRIYPINKISQEKTGTSSPTLKKAP